MIDPGIVLGIQPPRDAGLVGLRQAMQVGEEMKTQREGSALDSVMQSAIRPDGSVDRELVQKGVVAKGMGHLWPKVEAALDGADRARAGTQTARQDYMGSAMAGVEAMQYDPDTAISTIAIAVRQGMLPRDVAAQLEQQIRSAGSPEAQRAKVKAIVDAMKAQSEKQRTLQRQDAVSERPIPVSGGYIDQKTGKFVPTAAGPKPGTPYFFIAQYAEEIGKAVEDLTTDDLAEADRRRLQAARTTTIRTTDAQGRPVTKVVPTGDAVGEEFPIPPPRPSGGGGAGGAKVTGIQAASAIDQKKRDLDAFTPFWKWDPKTRVFVNQGAKKGGAPDSRKSLTNDEYQDELLQIENQYRRRMKLEPVDSLEEAGWNTKGTAAPSAPAAAPAPAAQKTMTRAELKAVQQKQGFTTEAEAEAWVKGYGYVVR